jgi:hypothetical protein
LGCANLEDLYSAVGGGAIRLEDVSRALAEVGISRANLRWTTINMIAEQKDNRPGVLSLLSGLVSSQGGNILRSVNNTLPDGGFSLRLVIAQLGSDQKKALEKAFLTSGITFRLLEIVR